MTVEFALDRIPGFMQELGYTEGYTKQYRHIQLDSLQSLNIDSFNEYHFLIEPPANLTIKSKMGYYDSGDVAINQMQYIHRGRIQITNKAFSSQMILFIQVIPNQKRQ
jgi:hypothetical protein